MNIKVTAFTVTQKLYHTKTYYDFAVGISLFISRYILIVCSCRLLTLFKNLFFFFQNKKKHISRTLSECQTVWIHIRTNILSVLILVQTVCKGYQSADDKSKAEIVFPYKMGPYHLRPFPQARNMIEVVLEVTLKYHVFQSLGSVLHNTLLFCNRFPFHMIVSVLYRNLLVREARFQGDQWPHK